MFVFDIVPNALSSVASFLFPVFASYKALKTSDPAQLTPWLMYWVVLANVLLVESWFDWFLVWIPFYAYARFFFLLYLVLPQTQGARHLYQTRIHPFLDDNEAAIEDFIASAHDRLRTAGLAYLKRAIEAIRTSVLGLAPRPEEAAAAGVQNARAEPQSYTQNLLARFSLPAARWSGNAGAGAAAGGQDFYGLLAGAVSAAATGLAGAAGAREGGASGERGLGGSGGLIPDHIGEGERADFIATQRERLSVLMRALDREAAQTHLAYGSGGAPEPSFENPFARGDREQTPTAGNPTGGLTKSRSEAEFEKIEAESGEENEQIRKRGTPGTGGGSWMPWGSGWSGATGGGDAGKSSGVDKSA